MSCRQASAQDSNRELPEHDQVRAAVQRVRETPTIGVLCSEPLLCVMEESGPAMLDHALPSSVSQLHEGTRSCSNSLAALTGLREWATSNFVYMPPHVVLCDLYLWLCVLLLRVCACVCVCICVSMYMCVHSLKACHDQFKCTICITTFQPPPHA